MYKHLLIATDGSRQLSKLALQEGVALAKALGAHVTAITVTPPFHIFTSDPAMVADTADEYSTRGAAQADPYLDVAKHIAAAAGVACDLVHLEQARASLSSHHRHCPGPRLRCN